MTKFTYQGEWRSDVGYSKGDVVDYRPEPPLRRRSVGVDPNSGVLAPGAPPVSGGDPVVRGPSRHCGRRAAAG